MFRYFEGIHSFLFLGGRGNEGSDELVGFYTEDVVREWGGDVGVESGGVGEFAGELDGAVAFGDERPAAVVGAEESGRC